jgi:tetratricopeptide (TPR) repeat protein
MVLPPSTTGRDAAAIVERVVQTGELIAPLAFPSFSDDQRHALLLESQQLFQRAHELAALCRVGDADVTYRLGYHLAARWGRLWAGEVAARQSQTTPAIWLRAVLFHRLGKVGDRDGALKALEVTQDPIAKTRAAALRARLSGQPALAAYQSVTADAVDGWIQVDLARLLRAQQRYSDARQVLDKLLVIDPTFLPAHIELGWLALENGDSAGATSLARKLTAICDGDPYPHLLLAGCLIAARQLAEAKQLLDRLADEFGPDQAEIHLLRARLLLAQGEPELAAQTRLKAERLDPGLAGQAR